MTACTVVTRSGDCEQPAITSGRWARCLAHEEWAEDGKPADLDGNGREVVPTAADLNPLLTAAQDSGRLVIIPIR